MAKRDQTAPGAQSTGDLDRLLDLHSATARGVVHQREQQDSWVKLFLAIASAAIAFLSFSFGQRSLSVELHLASQDVVSWTLVVVLFYGILTLHAVAWRERHIQQAARSVRAIEMQIRSINPTLRSTFREIQVSTILYNSFCGIIPRARGSVKEFLYSTNALLVIGAITTKHLDCTPLPSYWWPLMAGAGILAVLVQRLLVRRISTIPDRKVRKRRKRREA